MKKRIINNKYLLYLLYKIKYKLNLIIIKIMSENDKTIVFELSNFSKNLNLDYYLPHQSLFLNDTVDGVERENFNSLYSTLYLLTNSKFLMGHFMNLNQDRLDGSLKIFFDMIQKLYDGIKNLKDLHQSKNSKDINSEEEKYYSLMNDSINEFKKTLKGKKIDPRYLIADILFQTIKTHKYYSFSNETSIKNSDVNNKIPIESEGSNSTEIILDFLPKNFSDSSLFSLSDNSQKSYENSFTLLNESQKTEIENNSKDIVIQVEVGDEKKYICINFIIFKLEEDKIFKFEDCFKNFLDNLAQNRIPKMKKKIFYKLPETLIILLFFGKENENPENRLYDFKEVIDFSENEYTNYLDENVRRKKYILSGLLSCKFPKKYNKFFYTFCRNNKNEYYMYNCMTKAVNEQKDVNNKLQKLETVNDKSSTSYPYVLIYNEITN